MMQAEVRHPLSPIERWYWIADFPARIGDWKLSGAQFITGVSISGYLVTTPNTSHDELSWNFSYIDDAVSHRSAQRFADGCRETLLRAIA